MKKILLSILLLLPLFTQAQDESKYLKGAVNFENGLIVFNRHISTPELTGEQIYSAAIGWATSEFTGENQEIILADGAKKSITARVQRIGTIRVGLFPSKVKIHFYLEMQCFNGGCNMQIKRVHYTNNPSSSNPLEIIKAENYITDKDALNKAGTKLLGGTGSYRKATIDAIDELAVSAKQAMYNYNTITIIDDQRKIVSGEQASAQASQQVAVQPQTTQQQQIAQQQNVQQQATQQRVETVATVNSNATTPEGFIKIAATKIPGNIIKAVSDNGIQLTAVNGLNLSKSITGEGGLGSNNGEAALFFIFKGEKTALGTGDTIRVQLVNEVYKNAVVTMEPWLIMDGEVTAIAENMAVCRIVTVFTR